MSDLSKISNRPLPRDAVHVAVESVIASRTLEGGERIGFTSDDMATVGPDREGPGVVDPFITRPVKKGEHFYMFLYPGQVKSLTHTWDLSGFKAASSLPPPPPSVIPTPDSAEEQRMTVFAAASGKTRMDLIKAANEYLDESGGETYGFRPFNSDIHSYEADFWEDFEEVTGRCPSKMEEAISGYDDGCRGC